MTKQSDVKNDKTYHPLLNHGFVYLVDSMGSDAAIIQAARTSYGTGTKTVSEDRGLIRYLIRHSHTSPVEQAELKFHIKIPIFVMRQLVRQRMASLNEYSGRYSEMSDEFYVPEKEHIMPQSTGNKQGRSGEVSEQSKKGVVWLMEAAYDHAYKVYEALLGKRPVNDHGVEEVIYDAYDDAGDMDALFDQEFNGIARELARSVLPVANYTELYWKIDLHNLFRFLKLRADSHAQYEIRILADAIYDIIKPMFPFAVEAWEDYERDAVKLSRMEKNLTKDLLAYSGTGVEFIKNGVVNSGSAKDFALSYGMSIREFKEFVANFELDEALV